MPLVVVVVVVVPAHPRADGRDRESAAGSVVRGGFGVFEAEDDFDRFFVFDDFGVSGNSDVSRLSCVGMVVGR